MGLLSRFLGDDQKLSRPNFNRYRHIELNFSGNKLRFIDAKHTAMYPLNTWPENIDIYNADKLNGSEAGDYAKLFYVRGWALRGRNQSSVGSCNLESLIFYFPNSYSKDINCFNKKDIEFELIKYAHNTWSRNNDGANLGSLGSGDHIYPIDSTGFSYKKINKITWCCFTSQYKGDSPEIVYATPISKNHILINRFSLEAHGSYKFYSPETNLEQTSYDVMHDFMDQYHIELSPRSVSERSEVDDPI